ncbi:AbiH family protein [Mycoplasma marinum]|uniref:SIR2-like domain-containing protein n=1 Tax=Mycoplasma marinum TaxID=1937190 RepID=A0A4R0XS91_9MOLU|nr:AbiH family protein [Mycoplasma marinum]TCG10449.1 hypothetical protein C4B24_04620 [Mycoplasma marinum]
MNTFKNTLFIIGNGFDIRNGLETRFIDFETWLTANDKEALNKLEKMFGLDEGNWNKLEDKIFNSKPNFDYFIGEFQENASWNLSGEWEEEYHIEHEISLAVSDEIESNFISSEDLNNLVKRWIMEALKKSGVKKIKIMPTNSLINFNYTNYIIGNVLHIHGNVKTEIQFGHSNDSKNYRPKGSYGNEDHTGEFWYKLYHKNISKNIEVLNHFLNGKNFERVIFFGFSLGMQDEKYIEVLNKEVDVLFYFFSEEDKIRAKTFFNEKKFKSIQYIKSNNFDYKFR